MTTQSYGDVVFEVSWPDLDSGQTGFWFNQGFCWLRWAPAGAGSCSAGKLRSPIIESVPGSVMGGGATFQSELACHRDPLDRWKVAGTAEWWPASAWTKRGAFCGSSWVGEPRPSPPLQRELVLPSVSCQSSVSIDADCLWPVTLI